jgi:hypothetical protein
MEQKGFIRRVEEPWGNKRIIKYSVTVKNFAKGFYSHTKRDVSAKRVG